MARRLTDTDKWKKPLMRALEAPYKLLMNYINDDCDHAGLWQVDREVAELRIGQKIDWENALEILEGLVIGVTEDKWYIIDFIDTQYGTLNPQNRAHASAMALLEKHNLLGKNKALIRPLQGAKDMDMDKDKDKDKDKEKGGVGEFEEPTERRKTNWNYLTVEYQFFTPEFEEVWRDFVQVRMKKKKPLTDRAIRLNLNDIQRLSGGNPELAFKICEQSVKHSWDGFYELKVPDGNKPVVSTGFVIGQKHNAAG